MPAPSYHTYRDPWPATLNHPNAVQVESSEDWPKSYQLNSNHVSNQGIHPPGPIWNTPGAPNDTQGAAQQWWQYYNGGQQAQGYYGNGHYYAWPAATAPNGPAIFPDATCPGTQVHQAATAASHNAALAAMPQAPNYFPGSTPAEIAAQYTYLAQINPALYGAYGAMAASGAAAPTKPYTQWVPYKPADGQQFWCKETDGSWTLRTHSDIINGGVSPGHWERHATSGYYYWVREG